MTFDAAPTTKPLAVPTLAPPPQPSQPAPAPGLPVATISAVPQPATIAGKVQRWAANVSHDLQYGTDLTGVGSVMKGLGAHGLYNGNAPAVGDFIGSLPLGLLKATQGAGEVFQPGQRWQGVKDAAGGLLDASTMPAAFIAPEAGEMTAQGMDAGAAQAARAARVVAKGAGQTAHAIGKPFSTSAIQADFQQDIRNVLDTLAKQEGVTPSPSASIRDVAGSLADSILARSKASYQALDAATGGRFQRFDDAAKNVNQRLRETVGLDDENEEALLQRKAEIETAQNAAFEDARRAGVDPKIVDQARADWAKGQALHDVDRNLKQATGGMRPELAAGPDSSPEVVNPRTAFTRFNRLFDSGRLQQALGPDHAASLIQEADAAFLKMEKIAARVKAAKTVGKVTGTGAALEPVMNLRQLS